MPITDILTKNADFYPNDVSLVEINPKLEDNKNMTWREFALMQSTSKEAYRHEITWGEFQKRSNRFANFLLSRGLKKGEKQFNLSDCPDLGPVLMMIASFAEGKTKIFNAGRLRIKESDRIEAMVSECKKMGCEIEVINDELYIYGGYSRPSIELDGWKDHRIVMACAIALTKLGGTIHGCEAITKSYPSFFEDLQSVGIEVVYD